MSLCPYGRLNQMELSKTDSMATVNDVSTVSDVSDPHHPVSGSPGTLSGATGRLSPQRSRLMKDQETVRGSAYGVTRVCLCYVSEFALVVRVFTPT